eukprot:1148706-Pelagomonas_calceolata.AAC.3
MLAHQITKNLPIWCSGWSGMDTWWSKLMPRPIRQVVPSLQNSSLSALIAHFGAKLVKCKHGAPCSGEI